VDSSKYSRLLEPGYIGKVKTRSRLIKTGANPGFYPYDNGMVQQPIVDYYEALAAGGAGIVTVGSGEIDYPIGTVPNHGYRLDGEEYIPSLKRLADAIHRHSCPAFIQMLHMGPMHPTPLTGFQGIAASALTREQLPRADFSIPKEMSHDEVQRVKGRFIFAAQNVQKAGFDGIELNAGCNHLINSFLSRRWNKRQDEYGFATIENRARFLVEIIRGIKETCGEDFSLIVLINSMELGLEEGITLEESKAIARLVEKAGADCLHPRVEYYTNPRDPLKRDSTHFPDMLCYPEAPEGLPQVIDVSRHGAGAWVPAAAEIKKVVSIPVIAVGRLSPELGEQLLRDGKADFISFNRRLMADHDLPRKLAEGREEDIAPCTACMTCYRNVEHAEGPRCRINAALGREKEYEIRPAVKKKSVMIVGGGPAALEAARVAALRGHKVALYTAMSRLGGSMLVAAVVKGTEKEDLPALIRYFEAQLRKLGVEVHLGTEVTPRLAKSVKPDVLLLASGARHNVPDIPGIHSRKVMTSEDLHRRLKRLLRFAGPDFLRWGTKFVLPLMLGKEVVIVGGRLHGCQTAEFLVKRGRNVTIVDSCPVDQIGEGLLETLVKPFLLIWLEEKGVRVIAEATLEEVNKQGLVITTKDGKQQTLRAGKIVTAMPMLADTELFREFQGVAEEVYVLGDARAPAYIVDAVEDGARMARLI
jgi:2,4-dienoyl-CoA reductase (NADPH2)